MPPTDNIRIAAMENFTDAEGLRKFNLNDQEYLMSKIFKNTVEFQEDNLTTISGRTIYNITATYQTRQITERRN